MKNSRDGFLEKMALEGRVMEARGLLVEPKFTGMGQSCVEGMVGS